MKIYKYMVSLFIIQKYMNKYLRIGLYVLLIIAITIVALLMLGSTNPVVDLGSGLSPEFITAQEEEEEEQEPLPVEEPVLEESAPTFEEDVMKDLESFFGNSNGYENVWWDFWFTNEEAN